MSGREKWGRTVLVAIGLAAVHFVIMMFAFMSLMWGARLKWWARGLPSLFVVLGFPASFIIGRWTEADPNPGTLSALIGTSLLWGTGLARALEMVACTQSRSKATG
jgi:hypothetical protein